MSFRNRKLSGGVDESAAGYGDLHLYWLSGADPYVWSDVSIEDESAVPEAAPDNELSVVNQYLPIPPGNPAQVEELKTLVYVATGPLPEMATLLLEHLPESLEVAPRGHPDLLGPEASPSDSPAAKADDKSAGIPEDYIKPALLAALGQSLPDGWWL